MPLLIMADVAANPESAPASPTVLDQGTYEILRQRLNEYAAQLRDRLVTLNDARKDVFGSIKTALLATERVTTANKCVPRDMVPLGKDKFLFGYNVHLGLKSEIQLSDVFSLFEVKDHKFTQLGLELFNDEQFHHDFRGLYKYYKNTVFSKFSVLGPHLFMVFQAGKSITDIKTFKWALKDDALVYLGNRSDHEFVYPPQHEFEWKRTHRELHRGGLHPHIAIEDRLFVETIHGDLTIKVEDNTDSGEGIFSEPVDNKDQTLDDAEIFYALVGNLILLKIRPYQEKAFRYFAYNEKLREVRRVPAIENACVLLPDSQGIIHPKGFYLQTGEFKEFETNPADMMFERRVASPNGEDHLYAFYNRERGEYTLMSYNVIEQKVESPLLCDGFSIFENGQMMLFKAQHEPQKHHTIQIWQTPYTAIAGELAVKKDSFLYKVGNAELVACMAECQELLVLLGKEDTYGNLYVDLLRAATSLLDAYFWLGKPEAFDLKTPVEQIKNAAASALEEFEKVVRVRKATADQVAQVTGKARQIMAAIPYSNLHEIGLFVQSLAQLRTVRGELIALKELRYVDLALVDSTEQQVTEHTAKLSQLCVEFLVKPEALQPYHQRATELHARIATVGKGAEAGRLEEEINAAAQELEMLIEVVTNLKIDDATITTAIVENISAVYANLNQSRASLKQKRKELQGAEAVAEFGSQMKLLDQGLANFLDLCDTPEKTEQYQNRLLVQIEELEGKFADFEEFIVRLSDKRNDICTAFESRKVSLVEARHKKANALMEAADRILKGIKHRLSGMKTLAEISGYCASDLMVEKVRNITEQLATLGDSVKSDDLQSRLKSTQEEAVRQLRDRQELFVEGENLVQFGKHRFSVNEQELELTMVQRDGAMFYHLAGTAFFEQIDNPDFQATSSVWGQEVPSEDAQVYRGEYLAWKMYQQLVSDGKIQDAWQWTDEQSLEFTRAFMSNRLAEGYTKGVHDLDAAKILSAILLLHKSAALLRYASRVRAFASTFWIAYRGLGKDDTGAAPATAVAGTNRAQLIAAKLRAFGLMSELFPNQQLKENYLAELRELLTQFASETALFPPALAPLAAEYLFLELMRGEEFTISHDAADLVNQFNAFLRNQRYGERFASARKTVDCDFPSTYHLVRDWLEAFSAAHPKPEWRHCLDEAVCLVLRGTFGVRQVIHATTRTVVEGILGSHARIAESKIELDLVEFLSRLREFDQTRVPAYQKYERLKRELLHQKAAEMRLDSFRPKVLTSFVRNQLIDKVFLPLIGDNLAKQMGASGSTKRTDRMGMLLLVSPPGYGKTTLVEYVANRLGLTYMKINGPALGEKVTSLDPAVAPNAAAREEILKLNLALEMGDNVMIYLDDIQHCDPEFLQKFISLCDAQRRIEGVYAGKPKTYDLRGRKVAVVMAGNPYTESGEKFKIPDMLANRADTYNLGDIAGREADSFKLSYLENALTSNSVLNRLATRSQKDVYALVKLAETGQRENLELEGSYSADEIQEVVNVIRKLIRIREVILLMNAQYIASAAQADLYRTEPPFKLQGSYRNMNRLAEKVVPVMNDDELEAIIDTHYKNEAQTLTTGAEANLLKYKELLGKLTPEDAKRWEEIKRTFTKTALLRSSNDRDPVTMIVQQLSNFSTGLDSIKDVLSLSIPQLKELVGKALDSARAATPPPPVYPPAMPPLEFPSAPVAEGDPNHKEVSISPETLQKIYKLLEAEGHLQSGELASKKPGEVVIRLAK